MNTPPIFPGQRLAHLLIRFSEPACVIDATGDLQAANGQFCDYFRISPGHFREYKCWDILQCRHHSGAPLCTPECEFLRLDYSDGATFDREVSLKKDHMRIGASLSVSSVEGYSAECPLILHTLLPGKRLSLNDPLPQGSLLVGEGLIGPHTPSSGPTQMRMLDFLFQHSALEDQICDHLIGVSTALNELADMGSGNTEIRNLALIASTDLQNSTAWLGDLFRLVRCEEGLETPVPGSFSLSEAVLTCSSGLLGDKTVTIHMNEDPVVVCDPGHLQKILRVLLGNVAVHGGPQAHIDLSGDGFVGKMEVSDNGNGIASHDLDALWDPSNLKGAVTMGLPLAKRLAHLNLGTLHLCDASRAHFRLTLPAPGKSNLDAPVCAGSEVAGQG